MKNGCKFGWRAGVFAGLYRYVYSFDHNLLSTL